MEVLIINIGQGWFPSLSSFHENGDLFLQSNNTMICVPENCILARSPVLRTIMDRLRRILHSDAGRTASDAVNLRKLDTPMVEAYCAFVQADRSNRLIDFQSRETYDSLVGQLKVAIIFGDKGAVRHAASRLHIHPDLTPVRRYILATEYRMTAWFNTAVNDLIDTPRTSWQPSDIDGLPGDALIRLLAIKDTVRTWRQDMIDKIPISFLCITCPEGCGERWRKFWRDRSIPVLRHWPHESPSHGDIISTLIEDQRENALIHKDPTCEQCLNANITILSGEFANQHNIFIDMMDDWRKSQRFDSSEAAREAIERRRGATVVYGGLELEPDMAFLAELSDFLVSDFR